MKRVHLRFIGLQSIGLQSVGLAVALLMLGAAPAMAQGFFGGFFGGFGGPPPRPMPVYPGYGRPEDPGYLRPRRTHRHPAEQVQQQKEAPKPIAKDATVFVVVIGDSLSQLLANGLDDALSDRRDVGVLHQGRGSSGLVARDYYDWPKTVDDMLASKAKIDVAVMMIGSNERQAMHVDGQTYDVGSPEWRRLYAERVMSIDEAFRKKGVPLIWVGVPITRDQNFADDMAALNEIYREAAAKTGATYIDTWDAFSDDDGDFDAMGPDINGQKVRLRTSDGIYFTKAGARKLANFVEAPIRRDLDGKAATPPVGAATSKTEPSKTEPSKTEPSKTEPSKTEPSKTEASKIVAPAPTVASKPVAAIKPDAGPIRNLGDAPTAPNGELATAASLLDSASAATSIEKGDVQTVPAGRADDLKWPQGRPPQP